MQFASFIQLMRPSLTAPGLGNYVEALVRRHDTEFNVSFIFLSGKFSVVLHI